MGENTESRIGAKSRILPALLVVHLERLFGVADHFPQGDFNRLGEELVGRRDK